MHACLSWTRRADVAVLSQSVAVQDDNKWRCTPRSRTGSINTPLSSSSSLSLSLSYLPTTPTTTPYKTKMSFLSNVSDFASALSHAQSHDGSSSESQDSLFSSAISHLDSRKQEYSETEPEVDEEGYMRAHQSVFEGGGEGETHDSGTVGTGAAMQAMKLFTSGGGESGSGGGMDKNVLIGMAMSQAGKLWEEKNGQGSVVCSSVPSVSFCWLTGCSPGISSRRSILRPRQR